MDWCLLKDPGAWVRTFLHGYGPLVPDFRVRVVAPNLHLYHLASVSDNRHSDREVQREPTLHAWSVLTRVNAVEDILVQLGREVASETMDLGLRLQYSERKIAVLAHRLVLSLLQIFQLLLVWVGQVAESEDVFGLGTTGVRRVVNLDDVWKLVWV